MTSFSEWLDTLKFYYPESMVSRKDLEYFYNATLRIKPKLILELGTGFGYSTAAWGFGIKDSGTNGVVVTDDIRDQNKVDFKNLGLPVTQIVPLDDLELLKIWKEKNRPIDILFIDTSHIYEQFRKELFGFMPLVVGECFVHDVMHHESQEGRVIREWLSENSGWKYEEEKTWLGIRPDEDYNENSKLGIGRLYKA